MASTQASGSLAAIRPIDLGGLPSRRGGGDGADIEPGKGVTQAPAVGEVVPQTGQDELRAHGLTAHKAEHQPQAQQHIAGPDGREDAQQAGEGLLPEKKEDRSRYSVLRFREIQSL